MKSTNKHMPKKTIKDISVIGKRALIRVDFNVPLSKEGDISNDRRIRAALPTIQMVLNSGGSAVLVSHLGKPKGQDPASEPKFQMAKVAQRLQELLPGNRVSASNDVVGPTSKALASKLKPGEILLLENVRFDPREQMPGKFLEKSGQKLTNDQEAREFLKQVLQNTDVATFAGDLRNLADVYVNDAFGTCHRLDVSMFAVAGLFPAGERVVGLLVEKELDILNGLLGSPKKPMVGIMGGAKVSDKILFIERILEKVDSLLVGGAMTYTFRAALGQSVGNSLVERDKLDLAHGLLKKAGSKICLPIDHVIADKLDASAQVKISDDIPDGWIGVDIGPETRRLYAENIKSAATVLWNGPMGKFEDEPFQAGTKAIAEAMAARRDAITVVGGGESAEAVEEFGFLDRMTHVSTGGGAFLEYVEGKPFAALAVVDEK
jgi:phosphoglycerate kinase